MMKNFKKTFSTLSVFAATLLVCAGIAFAGLSVEAAKKQGLVGERTDGMLGIVSTPSPDLTDLVNSTNAQRLEKYKDIAAKHGTDIEHVEAAAGKKLIELAPSGEFVMNAAGGWVKK